MTEDDREHWDGRYANDPRAATRTPHLPAVFASYEHVLPTRGLALDLACGQGSLAVWLAGRGLTVFGVDVSPVAVRYARDLASRYGVADRCTFAAVDLDGGLPDGPPVDIIVCHRFRDARLDEAIIERLAPGGVLAVAVLSEVGHGPGPFRAAPGELRAAFGGLEILAEGEAVGSAWLVGRA